MAGLGNNPDLGLRMPRSATRVNLMGQGDDRELGRPAQLDFGRAITRSVQRAIDCVEEQVAPRGGYDLRPRKRRRY